MSVTIATRNVAFFVVGVLGRAETAATATSAAAASAMVIHGSNRFFKPFLL